MSNDGKRAPLIARLINGLIDQSDHLELEAVVLPRRVNWNAKVDINDAGKLIGKKAAHLYSLRVLLLLMGKRFGEEWRLTALDPDEAPRVESSVPARPRDFNPSVAQDFLGQILDAILAEPAAVSVVRDSDPLDFVFVIRAKSTADYEILVTKVMVGTVYKSGPIELTPVAALGTLYRAYGRQQGVNFRVEVPSQ